MSHIIFPAAYITITISPCVCSLTIHLIIFPIAYITIAIIPCFDTLTFLFIIYPFSFIDCSICPSLLACAMSFILKQLAFIYIAIWIYFFLSRFLRLIIERNSSKFIDKLLTIQIVDFRLILRRALMTFLSLTKIFQKFRIKNLFNGDSFFWISL